ncbi:MAG: hypothetical protein JWQ88_3528 [Rhodoferax sp.]|nr:hypothetical protein [Rhodoferax sp.]
MTTDRQEPAARRQVAVLQSNYIPWKGYFDLIAAVDVFVLYDQMQYTREDWRNRNIIKAPQGPQWLTVPVLQKGRFGQRICETEIDGTNWARKHWKSIEGSYRKAPHFAEIAAFLEPIYLGETFSHLSQLNRRLIEAICGYLGIGTRIVDSSELVLEGDRSERVAGICSQLEATRYISGPAARSYLDESVFTARSIAVEWFDYGDYPTYRQLWGEFNHQVSIVDLLVHCGQESRQHMKLGSRQPAASGAANVSQPGPGGSP